MPDFYQQIQCLFYYFFFLIKTEFSVKKNLLHFFPIILNIFGRNMRDQELKISLTLYLKYFLTPKSVQEENIGRFSHKNE